MRGNTHGTPSLIARSRKEAQIRRFDAFGQSSVADCKNSIQHGWQFSQYVHIPEANDRPAIADHEGIPNCVPPIIRVLTAVDFDHQPKFTTGEISKIGADRQLPDEFMFVEPPVAQFVP